MNITVLPVEPNMVFDDIADGDAFSTSVAGDSREDNIYMRVTTTRSAKTATVNAVRLDTGELVHFDEEERVTLLPDAVLYTSTPTE